MEQFIREKIKDKPLNKKRLAKKAGTAALCGVAFAVAASIVFAIFLPVINRQSKKASDEKNNNDVQIATQQSGIDDSSDAYSEMVHKAQSPALLRSRLCRPISLHSQIIRQCRTSSTAWALRPRNL